MFIESASSVMIETIVGSRLTEVALNGRHTLLQQSQYLLLIPLDCLSIGEVEYSILVRHATVGILHMHATLDDFREETVLRCEVRQLPQAGMETVLLQLLQHTHGVLETVLCKLIVTLPVDAKPSRIKVDDIGRNAVLAQFSSNVEPFLLREVGDTAHPRSKRP